MLNRALDTTYIYYQQQMRFGGIEQASAFIYALIKDSMTSMLGDDFEANMIDNCKQILWANLSKIPQTAIMRQYLRILLLNYSTPA